MTIASSLLRGLAIAVTGALAATAIPACVDAKDDLPKGVVDQSTPPGSPEPWQAGKADGGGSTFAVSLESPHPYANNLDQRYVLELDGVIPSCASRARVHFAALRTERRFDFLHLIAPDGTIVQSLDGHRDGLWSEWVELGADRRIALRLQTDHSITDYGFRIDAVEIEQSLVCPPGGATCDPGYFDVTPTPGTCKCAGPRECAEDAWVEIEHTVGGGFVAEHTGRRLVGQLAQTVTYDVLGGETTHAIGTIDRAEVQALITAIVDSGLLDRPEVLLPSNWSESFRLRVGTRAVSFTRPQGTFPAEEAALIQRFEALFACGAGQPLACGADHTCDGGTCVEDEGCFCPAVYQPVCGADGRTYGNACTAACARMAVVHDGECGIAGDLCGGGQELACLDGFKCRFAASTYQPPATGATGACVAETYCDAPADCVGLPHIAVPGTWACPQHECAWVTGEPWQAVPGFAYATPHPYANNRNEWVQLYLPEGAAAMRLVASGPFELEQGYDKLEVWAWRSGAWVKVKTYTGSVGPAASDVFAGRFFYLHFVSDSSITRHGFELTAQYRY
jgi:hypothetical protein